MKLKLLANNIINFGVNRVIEILGVAISIVGILLLASLITFSPDDPNFIFPNDTKIKNILGFNGSFTADIFYQSFGVIALLIPFSLMITGINTIINKKFFCIEDDIDYWLTSPPESITITTNNNYGIGSTDRTYLKRNSCN